MIKQEVEMPDGLIQPHQTFNVLTGVAHERLRQDLRWGPENLIRPLREWILLLTEELGEVARAYITCMGINPGTEDWIDFHTELIQLAAVAVAAVETFELRERLRKPYE